MIFSRRSLSSGENKLTLAEVHFKAWSCWLCCRSLIFTLLKITLFIAHDAEHRRVIFMAVEKLCVPLILLFLWLRRSSGSSRNSFATKGLACCATVIQVSKKLRCPFCVWDLWTEEQKKNDKTNLNNYITYSLLCSLLWVLSSSYQASKIITHSCVAALSSCAWFVCNPRKLPVSLALVM